MAIGGKAKKKKKKAMAYTIHVNSTTLTCPLPQIGGSALSKKSYLIQLYIPY